MQPQVTIVTLDCTLVYPDHEEINCPEVYDTLPDSKIHLIQIFVVYMLPKEKGTLSLLAKVAGITRSTNK